jgi:hypothetical protein
VTLTKKNVLLTPDGTTMLLDWDAAGPADPRAEIITAALDWSGVHDGEPEPRLIRAMLDGYRNAGAVYDRPDRADLAGFFRTYLNWLEFNLRRCLGERLQGPADRQRAEGEVLHSLKTSPRFASSVDAWVRLLASA